MGTKKKAKSEPAETPVETAAPALAAGMIWTDPKDGQKYKLAEADDKKGCGACHFYKADADCPEVGTEGGPLCESVPGMLFIFEPHEEPAPAPFAPAADLDQVPKVPKAAKAKAKKPAEAAAKIAGLTTRQIDIPAAKLIHAEWNKRGVIEPEDVADLVASIKAVGLIQRIAVRENPVVSPDLTPRYTILAGHRRYEACKIAGLDPIPCEVIECDGKQAHMITAIENLHRTDLTAMQEAEVVEDLLEEGLTAEEVHEQTGRNLRWVYRRASIRTLTPKWRNKAHVEGLCAAFLEEVSRLPPATQDAVLDRLDNRWDCKSSLIRGGDVAMVKEIIADLTMQLSKAQWAKKHPEWCAGCTRCSDARADLFDETEIGDNALCLDKACWEQRKADLVEEQRAELEEKHGEVKTASDSDYRYGRYSEAKGRKDKTHTAPVLITDGDNAGKVVWVAGAADKAAAKERGEPVEGAKQPTIEQKRMAWVIKKVDAMLDESKKSESRPCPFENMGELATIRAVTQFGTHWNQRNADGTDWEELDNGIIDDVTFNLWTQVVPVLKMRMMFQAIITCESAYDEAVACAAWAFNLSKEDLDAEAAEVIKDKSKKGEKI